MASLYDLELQESNNFIHALVQDGTTPALKLLNEQFEMAKTMGDVGKEMLAQFEDPNSDISKSCMKLRSLKTDINETMAKVGLTREAAEEALKIFNTSPESLQSLEEAQRGVIQSYWLKKKTIIVLLLNKGYTHEELFG